MQKVWTSYVHTALEQLEICPICANMYIGIRCSTAETAQKQKQKQIPISKGVALRALQVYPSRGVLHSLCKELALM